MANETLVVNVSTLDFVYSQMQKRYRPRQGRMLIRRGRAVPSWVENLQLVRVESTADVDILQNVSQPNSIPLAEFRSESTTHPLLHGITGYKLFDYEEEAIAQMGPELALNPTVQRAAACQLRWEMLIEEIIAGTTWKGQTFLGVAGQSASASPSATQVKLLTAATKAVTGTVWTTANVTAAEMHADLKTLANQVRVRSQGTDECTAILLPPSRYELAAGTLSAYKETSAIDLFRMTHPRVRVEQWYALETRDAAGTGPRAIALAEGSPDSPEFVEPAVLTPKSPIPQMGYMVIPMRFTVVGVLVENPYTLCYMDGI